jgi:hypothetical protein
MAKVYSCSDCAKALTGLSDVVKAIAAIAAEQATAFRRIVFILFVPSLWPLWAINAGASGFDLDLLFATYEDDWRAADLCRLYPPSDGLFLVLSNACCVWSTVQSGARARLFKPHPAPALLAYFDHEFQFFIYIDHKFHTPSRGGDTACAPTH